MLLSLVTLLSLVSSSLAYQPNENIAMSGYCKGTSVRPYCGKLPILVDSTFNVTAPTPLTFKVFNATYVNNKQAGTHSKNISDTPIYTKTLQPSDYTVSPTTGRVEYTFLIDIPAGNFINAYLYDSQDRQMSFPYIEGYYVARSASFWAGNGPVSRCLTALNDPYNATTCNRTRFDASNPQIPFDEGSTVAFNKSAWTTVSEPVPYGGAHSVLTGPGSSWILVAGAGVLAAMGAGLSL